MILMYKLYPLCMRKSTGIDIAVITWCHMGIKIDMNGVTI